MPGSESRARTPSHRQEATPIAGRIGPEAESMLIEPLLAEWDRDMAARLGKPASERKKCLSVVREMCAALGATRPKDIRRPAVLSWLTAYIERSLESRPNGNPQKTAKTRLSRLRAFASFMLIREAIETDPFDGIKLPKGRSGKGADAFTADQLWAVIAAARERESRNWQAGAEGPLASTFYAFLGYTGFRKSEAGRQRWDDVDLDRGRIRLTGDKSRRNDGGALSAACVALLREWRAFSPGELVFPKTPSHHTLKMDVAAAGVPGKGEWHRARKCAITERAKAGAPVRELMKFARHTDASVTLGHYDDLGIEELRRTAELFPAGGQIDLTSRGERDDDMGASLETPMVATPVQPSKKPRPFTGTVAPDSQSATIRPLGGRAFPLGSRGQMEPGGIDTPASPASVPPADVTARIQVSPGADPGAVARHLRALADLIEGRRA